MSNDYIDPLEVLEELGNTDYSEVDTSFPNLMPGQYEFKVSAIELKDSESGGKYILVNAKLVSDNATDTTGSSLAPGYPIRHMINLTPSAKQLAKSGKDECIKRIKQDIAKFTEALTGPQRKWHGLEGLDNYIGMSFFAKTRVSKEREDPNTGTVYSPQSEIAALIPKTENDDSRDPF